MRATSAGEPNAARCVITQIAGTDMLTAACPSLARQVPCEKCPLRAQPSLRDFSQDELDFIITFKSGELTAAAGTTLLIEGTASAHLYTVLSGWAVRYKMLPDARRQILNFV